MMKRREAGEGDDEEKKDDKERKYDTDNSMIEK